MTAVAVGGYRPRHARPRVARPAVPWPVVIWGPAALLAVALTSAAAWQIAEEHPVCAHWVNPAHLGWPHSQCDVQAHPAPSWWVKGDPRP